MWKKLRRLILVVLLLGAIALAFLIINPVFLPVSPATLNVDADSLRLKEDVEAICNKFGSRDYANLAGLNGVAGYIKTEFEKAGLTVKEQHFKANGNDYKNVIATYGPADAPLLIVGAHYDACDIHAGADDNASGVAGLLELARMISKEKPVLNYQIEFVAYTLEEPPFFGTDLMGSAIHAQSIVDDGVDVKAMMCLEMIGYFTDAPNSQDYPTDALRLSYPTVGNFITVVGQMHATSLVRSIKKNMMAGGSVDVHSINAPAVVPGIDFSDHRNYWAHAIPAVMITNTAFYRNHNYHEASDLPETLDYGRMREVVKGVYWAITHFE